MAQFISGLAVRQVLLASGVVLRESLVIPASKVTLQKNVIFDLAKK